MVWKSGYRVKEIPIVFVDRTIGESKITYSIVREAVWRVWALRLKYLFGKK
jgi:dolichol-phosphate mannosyltransferase